MERNYLSALGINLKVRFSKEEIEREVARLAREINEAYAGEELLAVVVLNGAFIFAADLLRAVQVPLQVDFVKLSSYVGTSTSGQVLVKKDLECSVEGRHVLVVEDIVDTGITLSFLLEMLRSRGAKSVRICTLVNKKAHRERPIVPEYVGMECGSGFLVGYGLDLDERMRELSAIYEVTDTPLKGTA
ncbi:hypoxanthine phosphoribosyltransferase [Geomonas sp. RF6]|uniref:hypoxanthine phosphoribosyltransferase n=1 Tax=Geomonas sp. RF6 TaxID=2897342 RepID=UPI001E464D02|nr:hypoxanthine phosphoribosyltransferase [Geomonas sp. RF6]UFS70599.1 hypoxanthine phosphoribosyltransferase [Geomonas sp. RF6]